MGEYFMANHEEQSIHQNTTKNNLSKSVTGTKIRYWKTSLKSKRDGAFRRLALPRPKRAGDFFSIQNAACTLSSLYV